MTQKMMKQMQSNKGIHLLFMETISQVLTKMKS